MWQSAASVVDNERWCSTAPVPGRTGRTAPDDLTGPPLSWQTWAGHNTPHSPRLVVTKSSKLPSQASCHWLWPTACHGYIIYYIYSDVGGHGNIMFYMFIIFNLSLVPVIRKFKILFWGNIRTEGDTPVVWCATLHTDQELLSALKNSSNQWMHNNSSHSSAKSWRTAGGM